MSKTRDYLQRKAAARIPAPVLDAAGKAVLKGVDKAVTERWDAARQRALRAEGSDLDAKVKSVAKSFSRELVALGAATGAAAAAPGIGTASAVSVLGAEIGWFAFRSTDLIMTIGALHGHVDSSPEERRAWVLSILAFGENAADEFTALAGEMERDLVIRGERIGALVTSVAGSDVATVDALRRMNATLASKVLGKYGSRKGMASVGKLLPFGIGAVVGGSANWAMSRTTSSQARRFFRDYRPIQESWPPPPLTSPPPPPPPPPPVAAIESSERPRIDPPSPPVDDGEG